MGVRGGIEYAFSSTTVDREQALLYAQANPGQAATIFEMQVLHVHVHMHVHVHVHVVAQCMWLLLAGTFAPLHMHWACASASPLMNCS